MAANPPAAETAVAILCGGRGTRLQERTHAIPKALVEIGASERVVLYITGEGLKTLDAIRDGHRAYEIDASLEAFEREVAEPTAAASTA